MTKFSAYFFAIHGSRNRQTLLAADRLERLLTLKIKSQSRAIRSNLLEDNSSDLNLGNIGVLQNSKTPLIEIAALELAPLPLHESLIQFAEKAYSQGFNRVKVFPLFLAPGVHVQEDIPKEISLAIKQLNDRVTIELSTFLGKYSGIVRLIAQKFASFSVQARILVSHGSRLPGVTDYYQSLARKVNAANAYWSSEPSLASQVKVQVDSGNTSIAIVPYFLFPGKITNAIAVEVEKLQMEYPDVKLFLGEPLGATEALAELIAKEI